MKQLHIYPTARALRAVSIIYQEQDSLLPALMSMDEFEKRAMLMEGKIEIDPLQRVLFLKEAADFQAFRELKLDLELVKFFTKSDALFKFFEELAGEKVSFMELSQADAYVEFESHLLILETLLNNYHKIIDAKGLTDKAFIPNEYKLNIGFLKSYDAIEIHLEGYLSRFEVELLMQISQVSRLTVHYITSNFNLKMQERFASIGINLPNNSIVSFDVKEKIILKETANNAKINAKVYAVEERQEQIAVAFVQIEQMIDSGIAPEEIALILPDEEFKEQFVLFDTHNNLNFAMGYSYSNSRIYKLLQALYNYWQSYDEDSRYLLDRYGFKLDDIDTITATKPCEVEEFFELLKKLKISGFKDLSSTVTTEEPTNHRHNERVYEQYLHFSKILCDSEMSLKEWLFLWLKSLYRVTTDDLHGGKITVMGVLETRGVSFEGVVIVDFNDGIVPTSSSKDQFLSSSVRAFANLPTKSDREALQKQYYRRLLEQASSSVILYSSSDNKLPSKFLYELGLDRAIQTKAQYNLLYEQSSSLAQDEDPIIEGFDVTAIVWSASRLQTYLECKRKYYYRYIQKIKAKKETELNEGAFLHSVLEHLYKKQDSYSYRDELQKSFDMLLDELLPFDDSKTAYRKLLWKKKLSGFVDSQIEHFATGWKVIGREIDVVGNIGGLEFRGRIDRIDQNDTHTLILDYKSGTVPKEPKSLNPDKITDFQMSIYYYLLKKRYQHIRLAFVKIFEDGAMQEVSLLEEREELLGEHIVALKQTKTLVANKCEEISRCRYCEFTLMCGRGDYL